MDDQAAHVADYAVCAAAAWPCRAWKFGVMGRVSLVVAALGVWPASVPVFAAPTVYHAHDVAAAGIVAPTSHKAGIMVHESVVVGALAVEEPWKGIATSIAVLCVSDVFEVLDLERHCVDKHHYFGVWE